MKRKVDNFCIVMIDLGYASVVPIVVENRNTLADSGVGNGEIKGIHRRTGRIERAVYLNTYFSSPTESSLCSL